MNIGTWNVKGLRTKQKEVIDELMRLKMDIAVLTETKKKGKGSERIGEYTHLYSGVNMGDRAKAGVSVNERILKVELKLKGFDVIVIQ